MKEKIQLNKWKIANLAPEESEKENPLKLAEKLVWIDAPFLGQVQEILLNLGEIEDPAMPGKEKECMWVAERDWLYKTSFNRPKKGKRIYVNFPGLDTIVDVYLNGKLMGSHNNMYLPLRLEITSGLEETNELVIHFHSPHYWVEKQEIPERYEGKFEKNRILRKPNEDFNWFNGCYPYFTTIGPYDEIFLETTDEAEISLFDLTISFPMQGDYSKVEIAAKVEGKGNADVLILEVLDPTGEKVATENVKPEIKNGKWSITTNLEIINPELWWPREYGTQPLYTIAVTCKANGEVCEVLEKKTGIREIITSKPFDISVNGKKVKLWGANFTPMEGISHRWNRQRCNEILDLCENANFTTLRAWGPGAPYHDHFYEECDKRGILVWAEFFHTWGNYPDDEYYIEQCRQEAIHHVKQMKHHPSIFMWCGGNENYMGAFVEHGMTTPMGAEIYEIIYPAVVKEFDPNGFYYENSPYDGPFANSPLKGDSHSYSHVYFLPHEKFPTIMTENTRISLPGLKTMKRYFGDEVWPNGFDATLRTQHDLPFPEKWFELVPSIDFVLPRLAQIEAFHETMNTPEGVIYRIGSAHAKYIRDYVERYRRGKPADDAFGERRTYGHYIWKLNNTWPMIFSNMIDYYLEPNMSYYGLKRAYQPVLLSFDIEDNINLWVINDTGSKVSGKLTFQLWDIFENKVLHEFKLDVFVGSGESKLLANLDELGAFFRKHLLYMYLEDENGNKIAESMQFAEIERRLKFPETVIELKQVGDKTVELVSEKYVRSVELSGNNNGDEFGWWFEDNYFDLAPGIKKTIKWKGKHLKGTVTAKGWHLENKSTISIKS